MTDLYNISLPSACFPARRSDTIRKFISGFKYAGSETLQKTISDKVIDENCGYGPFEDLTYVLTNKSYNNPMILHNLLGGSGTVYMDSPAVYRGHLFIDSVNLEGYEDDDSGDWVEGQDPEDFSNIILEIGDLIRASGLKLNLDGTYSLNQEGD